MILIYFTCSSFHQNYRFELPSRKWKKLKHQCKICFVTICRLSRRTAVHASDASTNCAVGHPFIYTATIRYRVLEIRPTLYMARWKGLEKLHTQKMENHPVPTRVKVLSSTFWWQKIEIIYMLSSCRCCAESEKGDFDWHMTKPTTFFKMSEIVAQDWTKKIVGLKKIETTLLGSFFVALT